MSNRSDHRDFETILAAVGERELTDWERERLWELLEQEPERITEFADHCFVSAELQSLAHAELADSGIEPQPRNVVLMPGAEGERAPARWRERGRWLAGAAAATAAVLVAFLAWSGLGREQEGDPESVDAPSVAAPSGPTMSGTVASASAGSELSAAPSGEGDPPGGGSPVAASRDPGLSEDDPNDEAVALSGANALANSRNPRGGKPEGAAEVPEEISYNQHVRPLLSENCFFCHGPDEAERKSGLRLDTEAGATGDLGGYAAVVPGSPGDSELWRRVSTDDEADMMPPSDSHRELNAADREILRQWIAEGAPYDAHWSFVPPERPEPPEATPADRIRNPIDAFVFARLEKEGLAPNPPADGRTVLRRLSLDMTGLPPAPEELAAFEKSYRGDPDAAVDAALDRLLDSPHYGERMAMPWLDAARYADSNGFQQDGNRHQWPWRDWVVDAYNDNMPFDRFTVEQLAGDLLPDSSKDQLIATAFNRNHMINGEGGAIKEEQRVNYVIDRVDTTATTWLGLTMACAQCHSHKYDPITHEEYYEFFAFFNNVPETGGRDKSVGGVGKFGSKAKVQLARPWMSLPTEEQTEEQRRLQKEIRSLEKEIGGLSDQIDPLRRKWENGFTTAELVDRERFPERISKYLRTPEEKRNAGQKRALTEFYLREGGHGKKEWKSLGNRIRQRRDELDKVRASIIEIMVMEEKPPEKRRETHILARGDYQQPTEKVSPGTPAFLPAMGEDLPDDRLGLARWLTEPDHPLTARVAVNRLWQQIFGVGIVKTAEDFGVQGELPSHPELLDWLAVEFVESGWDVKHVMRLIASSATYRQSARQTEEKRRVDPENRLLSRGARYRLPAMLLRDQALAVSDLLIPELGGEPVYPHQPEGLWSTFSFDKITYPHNDEPEQLHRRSLYTFWRRTLAPPNMFDSSSRQVCTVKPSRTNTPLHALTLLNDGTYVEAARALARRMVVEGGDAERDRLGFAFELCTGDRPDQAEARHLVNGFEQSLNEFRSHPGQAREYAAFGSDEPTGAVELAAYTRVAQIILNLDETLNRP